MSRLYPGALGPDWEERNPTEPRPDPPPMAQGGPIRTDPHPHDVPPGLYDAPPRDLYGDSAAEQSAFTRATWATRSPVVLLRLECVSCHRGATFYGREEQAPPRPFYCDRCTPPDLDAAA
jgi:hypothetical protein